MDVQSLWAAVLDYLKRELSYFAYNEYFIPIEPLKLEGGTMVLKVQNDMQRNILKNTYTVLLLSALRDNDDSVTNVEFIMDEAFGDGAYTQNRRSYELKLNEKYTFEEFVVGPNNRLAHAAAIGVAKEPTKYNPLFIYGGVGLGKTHLMQAIAHYVRSETPQSKIVYLSSEQFTNEFIDAIMNKSNLNFRQKYRNVDLLLIDDIQFLSGKEGTQEEFFHTFNELYNANKQIVITSDRPPKEIPELEDRLRSRFEWGLICDIQSPDFETRCAILKAKAEKEHFDISPEIIEFLAERVNSNIRELEGVLIKVKALWELGETKTLTVNYIRENLKHVVLNEKRISTDVILKTLCAFYNVTRTDLTGARRTKQIAYARQVGMYLCRELTSLSLPSIGEVFGGRDHTTVLYACEKIKNDLENNEMLKAEIDKLSSTIKNKNNQ